MFIDDGLLKKIKKINKKNKITKKLYKNMLLLLFN